MVLMCDEDSVNPLLTIAGVARERHVSPAEVGGQGSERSIGFMQVIAIGPAI